MANIDIPQIQILFPMDNKRNLEEYDIYFPSIEMMEEYINIKSKSKSLFMKFNKNIEDKYIDKLNFLYYDSSLNERENSKKKLYYKKYYDSIPNNIIIYKYSYSLNNDKKLLDKIEIISNHNIPQNEENENIILKYHLLKEHILIIDIKMLKKINEFLEYGFEEKDKINYKLLKFNNFNYIPCSIHQCPFPALIERKNNQIIVTCIQKHYCIYNTLLDLLLNLHFQNKKDICLLCEKSFNDLNDKWYCPKCEKYCHNNHVISHSHGLIEYKKLINYCNFHFEEMKNYCEECKRGICIQCEKNCREKKHEIKNFDDFKEEIIDDEIINYFIDDCKFEFFEYEKYICLQYKNMKKIKTLPKNFETLHNFNNYLKNCYPKIIGDFYFGGLYIEQKKEFDKKYLNDKTYLFFKILDKNNFIGYTFNKKFKWFKFDQSKNIYNEKEINISNENSFQNLFYDDPNLFIIDNDKYIIINELSIGKPEKCEGKIIEISNSIIVQKITNKEIKLSLRTDPLNFICIRNKPDIKIFIINDDMKLLYCIKKGKNRYEFCLTNFYLSNLYASTEINVGIYKLFLYNDYLLLVLYDFNILKAKIYELNFELLISKDEIMKDCDCEDCFISDTQLVFFSKEKVTYYPLLNNTKLN